MKPLNDAKHRDLASTRFVLSDLDDTITLDGRLPASGYAAMESLEKSGLQTVIVTGRPAGWCDMMARFWPISAVVGENGAFYFRYDHKQRTMIRRFQRSDAERSADQLTLQKALAAIQNKYPGVKLSADQRYRISDYAVDFCEDVERLPADVIADIVRIFEEHGATAKISSIHVNAWIGKFSKLEMSLKLLADEFGVNPDDAVNVVAYVGDSPNDEPMFEHFPLSAGVANLKQFADHMQSLPRWLCTGNGAIGFAEFATRLIKARQTTQL